MTVPAAKDPPEEKEAVVGPGDTLLSIAARKGFRDYRDLWNDGSNAALKKARVNPFSLVPGDRVQVVDLGPKKVDGRQTGQVHRFTVFAPNARLRLKVLDANLHPIGDQSCRVKTGQFGPPLNRDSIREDLLKTDSGGMLEVAVDRTAQDASIDLLAPGGETAERSLRVRIGSLMPVNSLSGQRARLNQLGFYAGFSIEDRDQLRWAIEEFEHAHGLPVKGKPDNPAFFNRLGHVHGDLLPSEQLGLPLVEEESPG